MSMIFSSEDEKALLLLLKEGDTRAFDKLYRMYSEAIFRNILKMVHDSDIAGELLQEVYLKIWERREQIDEEQPFKAYLYTISRNKVYDYFRGEALQRKMEAYFAARLPIAWNHVEEDIFYKESDALLLKAIDELPAQRKKVFVLCKVEGKSYIEVSELLGISESTISDHLLKANRFIRSQFMAGIIMAATSFAHLD